LDSDSSVRVRSLHRGELAAAFLLVLIVVGLPGVTLGYQYVIRPAQDGGRIIEVAARAPENGGFSPGSLEVQAGVPVTLRFTSEDVTHGIAIGPGVSVDLGHVDPGTSESVTLTFDRPGTYTIYCTTWCSRDHWRMRSVIQVRDPAHPNVIPTARPDPVIEALVAEGVDIDAGHTAGDEQLHGETHLESIDLSPVDGQLALGSLSLPRELQDNLWRRSHAPTEALALLTIANPGVAEEVLVSAIVYLWTSPLNPSDETQAATLYASNCAACHGETGGADGPASILTVQEPVAFDNRAYMMDMRDDVLYAKIRRGGMGTDMPNFGTLFTPDETWLLVRYLRRFLYR
jgi:plastocyanin